MADGMNAARPLAPEHVALLENLRDQLLIVFLKRLGGRASIPVAEIDDTDNDLFVFSIVNGKFYFEIQQKEKHP